MFFSWSKDIICHGRCLVFNRLDIFIAAGVREWLTHVVAILLVLSYNRVGINLTDLQHPSPKTAVTQGHIITPIGALTIATCTLWCQEAHPVATIEKKKHLSIQTIHFLIDRSSRGTQIKFIARYIDPYSVWP